MLNLEIEMESMKVFSSRSCMKRFEGRKVKKGAAERVKLGKRAGITITHIQLDMTAGEWCNCMLNDTFHLYKLNLLYL
jgi:hypothetical protein